MNHDLVVIHLDADVAREPAPYGPGLIGQNSHITQIIQQLRRWLLNHLGSSQLPKPFVICIPSDSIEAWLIAALDPALAREHDPWEAFEKPEHLLGSIVVGKKQVGKSQAWYSSLVPNLVAGWENVLSLCPQATVFVDDVSQAARSGLS